MTTLVASRIRYAGENLDVSSGWGLPDDFITFVPPSSGAQLSSIPALSVKRRCPEMPDLSTLGDSGTQLNKKIPIKEGQIC